MTSVHGVYEGLPSLAGGLSNDLALHLVQQFLLPSCRASGAIVCTPEPLIRIMLMNFIFSNRITVFKTMQPIIMHWDSMLKKTPGIWNLLISMLDSIQQDLSFSISLLDGWQDSKPHLTKATPERKPAHDPYIQGHSWGSKRRGKKNEKWHPMMLPCAKSWKGHDLIGFKRKYIEKTVSFGPP